MTRENLELIVEWFAHIEQIADDRKTANGVVMEDWAALDEIRCKAHNCQEYIKKYCIQSKPQGLDEAAEKFARSYDSGTCDGIAQDCFKAGAKWMAEQGVTIKGLIMKQISSHKMYVESFLLPDNSEFSGYKAGYEVIVQIRKKED